MKNIKKSKYYLKKIALNNKDISNGALIYKMLQGNSLDSIINNITKGKTIMNCNTIVKKGYYTENEQFISLLNNFIFYFDFHLPIMGASKQMIIESLFINDTPNFLLSKKDWDDNQFIPYYTFCIQKFIVTGFYNSIKRLYSYFETFFSSFDIFPSISMEKKEDVEKLFILLKHLNWSNYSEYSLYFLYLDINKYHPDFLINIPDEEAEKEIEQYYYIQWNILINNYYKTKK